jgi:hypothetical protein
MKLEMTVSEVTGIFKEIEKQPEQLFKISVVIVPQQSANNYQLYHYALF